jgi:hypothetical protein
MDAAEPLQLVVVEALHAEGNAVDAGRQIAVETAVLDGAGIGFQRDLGIGSQRQALAYAIEQALDQLRREQAGRAAAEEHADYRPADAGQAFERCAKIDTIGIQIGQQMVDVVGVRRRLAAQTMRVEIAIRAFLHAPRHVYV